MLKHMLWMMRQVHGEGVDSCEAYERFRVERQAAEAAAKAQRKAKAAHRKAVKLQNQQVDFANCESLAISEPLFSCKSSRHPNALQRR